MIDGGLRKIFKQAMPKGDWQAIETGATNQGVPDHNCCWGGKEFWIEYKKAAGWRVKFRPEQCGWIERRIRHGGVVFVAIRRTVGTTDELYLYHGSATRALITGGLKAAQPLGVWGGGIAGWNWAAVSGLLQQPWNKT